MLISAKAEKRIEILSWSRAKVADRLRLGGQFLKRRDIGRCDCPKCQKIIAVCKCSELEKDRVRNYMNRFICLVGAQNGIDIAMRIHLNRNPGRTT